MQCCCLDKEPYVLKVEGDIGADPFWCDHCGCNIDVEAMPISALLKADWVDWARTYGGWIDWNEDCLLPNGIELEDVHNVQGEKLTKKTIKELNGIYKVKFSPSSTARLYNRNFR